LVEHVGEMFMMAIGMVRCLRTGVSVIVASLFCGTLAACGHHKVAITPSPISNVPGATVVCDVSLGVGAGTYSVDATATPPPLITDTAAGEIFLKTSPDCIKGSEVRIDPSSQAKIVKSVPAKDGGDLAVVIDPKQGAQFHVIGSGAFTFDITVKLGPTPLPS
jgi:hypothetical protein